ncbi:MAG: AMP-binding protein, partial [Rhodospirillales bacterium]|nr:AMP-binding protein [Rhodospirillales bacterium]
MDYDSAHSTFCWADVFDGLGWTADGPVNIGATVDRHAANGGTAIDWHGKDGTQRQLDFAAIAEASNRFANVLVELGVTKGDRVAVIMPRLPETIIAMLGIWKAGAIYLPIFSGFGGEAIRMRLEDSEARVAIAHTDFRGSFDTICEALSALIVVGGPANAGPGTARRSRPGRTEGVSSGGRRGHEPAVHPAAPFPPVPPAVPFGRGAPTRTTPGREGTPAM